MVAVVNARFTLNSTLSHLIPRRPPLSVTPPARRSATTHNSTHSTETETTKETLKPVDTVTKPNGSGSGSGLLTELDRFGLGLDVEGDGLDGEKSVKDYFEQAGVVVKSSRGDGGGPRWFSPVECGRPILKGAPLLLYLPDDEFAGVDGVGLGLVRQHQKLGRIFELWCLHIPVTDRTTFTELVKQVEGLIRSEHIRSPRPIYLVGDSLGGCLALAVAARNPDFDLVLILSNPATSFSKSPLQLFSTPQMRLLASLMGVDPREPSRNSLSVFPWRSESVGLVVDTLQKSLEESPATKDLLQGLRSLASYYSVVADIMPTSTFLWKMDMLQNACDHANSRLHAVKAKTLILTSGRDLFLSSQEEGERLVRLISKCEIRKFSDNGHFLFLEDGIDLVYILKGAAFYRRGKLQDYVKDYIPPTPADFKRIQDHYWWYDPVTSPVMLSTLENGTIVRSLAGIPSEGPTLLVGYHMLLGVEKIPLVVQILGDRNISVRGIAHPLLFHSSKDGNLLDVSQYDNLRLLGAVPVSGVNLFKLLASKSHVLLYPGGAREALHRKGEGYRLFWPEQSEFVRMAARFGAKIVPFGAVGEDDISQLIVDYNDLVRIPYVEAQIKELTDAVGKLRSESSGEVANQELHLPGVLPKIPGRIYFLFGKPIETEGRRQELKDRQKAEEMYLEVKCEVERCLAYLKEKREHDPYRSILPRLLYKTINGNSAEVPTFEL